MVSIDSFRAKVVLMINHIGGLIDVVALPFWIGILISYYKLNPQMAGTLITLFLSGIVVSNIFFGPRLNKLNAKMFTVIGYMISALSFLVLSLIEFNYMYMVALHLLAGLGAGCGLTFTHGAVGKSKNPQFLYSILAVAIGIFAIFFFGLVPKLMENFGPPVVFQVFSGVTFLAVIASAFAFPTLSNTAEDTSHHSDIPLKQIPKIIWIAIIGMVFMSITHATVFGFLERIGNQNGFEQAKIFGLFMSLGLITLIPPIIAFFTEKKLNPFNVIIIGPAIQLAGILVVTQLPQFYSYAIGTIVMVCIFIFTQIFFFGLIARLEKSGRATAFTPSTIMIGSATGPILGGTVVQFFSYQTLGFLACITVAITIFCFLKFRSEYAIKEKSSIPSVAN